MNQGSILDLVDDAYRAPAGPPAWPHEPPEVASRGVTTVYADFETKGKAWWRRGGAVPVGLAIKRPGEPGRYLAWGHEGGGNTVDEATARRWAERELRGVHVVNTGIPFDLHAGRQWGVDLDAQGCTFEDVQHHAALLDDHRRVFNLRQLAIDLLPEGGRRKLDLDGAAIHRLPAGAVAPYAINDAELVHDIAAATRPLLERQGLLDVLALENAVIPAVVEMQANGLPLDVEYAAWASEELGRRRIESALALHREVGFKVNPDSHPDMLRLFRARGLEPPIGEDDDGNPAVSFEDALLATVDDAAIALARRYRKDKSADSKSFAKYLATAARDADDGATVWFQLHQLRNDRDGRGKAGTVSGRFSSAMPDAKALVGINGQQVAAVEKQEKAGLEAFLARAAFVPRCPACGRPRGRRGCGCDAFAAWLSADAAQIEYRLFAHYANSARIIDAYRRDPRLKFHDLIWDLLKAWRPDLTYKQTKNINFMKIYGGGLPKLALMLGMITSGRLAELRRRFPKGVPRTLPELREAAAVNALYERELPEVPPLLARAAEAARTRGFVRTLLGRRSRFPDGRRTHKALNAVIQGSAADVMKWKIVELHRERKWTGLVMRLTVHDEVDGDATQPETAARVAEILDAATFPVPTRVPILWDVATGANWAEASR